LLEQLRGLPRFDSLKSFVEAVLKRRDNRVVSIILFGSMAKGNYTNHSDYDVLIVVSKEELSFKDRLYKYSTLSNGWVEPFVYTSEEAESMLEDYNPLMLDALKDGIVIHDEGEWALLKDRFNEMLREGILIPKENGWIIKARPCLEGA